MTKFSATLTIPAGAPSADNCLLLAAITDCDRAGLRVFNAAFGRHGFGRLAPRVRALVLEVTSEHVLDQATEEEVEKHIQDQFTLNSCDIDAQIEVIEIE